MGLLGQGLAELEGVGEQDEERSFIRLVDAAAVFHVGAGNRIVSILRRRHFPTHNHHSAASGDVVGVVVMTHVRWLTGDDEDEGHADDHDRNDKSPKPGVDRVHRTDVLGHNDEPP